MCSLRAYFRSRDRTGDDVIADLLAERDRIVTDYGVTQRMGLVNWTSLFPGGHGVHRGDGKVWGRAAGRGGQPLAVY